MIEIDKVIYMDIGVYVFYMCWYVYIALYRYVLIALVCACSYLHIFTYSFGSYRRLIRLHFEVPYNCIVINISLFIYTEKFV